MAFWEIHISCKWKICTSTFPLHAQDPDKGTQFVFKETEGNSTPGPSYVWLLPVGDWKGWGLRLGALSLLPNPFLFFINKGSKAQADTLICPGLCNYLREGNGTLLQYSCLENPMDGGAWWAAVHGVTRSRTWQSDFIFTFHFHALEKEMATYSSVLAWRIPGTGEPGGLPSMGLHRVKHDWSDLAVGA